MVRSRPFPKDRAFERSNIAQGGAVHFVGAGPNIEKATAELKSQGYQLLVAMRTEPWGQVVTRLLGPEGLLVGITHTPSMRE